DGVTTPRAIAWWPSYSQSFARKTRSYDSPRTREAAVTVAMAVLTETDRFALGFADGEGVGVLRGGCAISARSVRGQFRAGTGRGETRCGWPAFGNSLGDRRQGRVHRWRWLRDCRVQTLHDIAAEPRT